MIFRLEELFSFGSEVYVADGDFPGAAFAARYGGAEGTADDLVTVADSDDADAALGKDLLGEGDEIEDPGVGIEGVVSCIRKREREGSAGWDYEKGNQLCNILKGYLG